jgi:hypothetical protein
VVQAVEVRVLSWAPSHSEVVEFANLSVE